MRGLFYLKNAEELQKLADKGMPTRSMILVSATWRGLVFHRM
jgi:hypothetical protein